MFHFLFLIYVTVDEYCHLLVWMFVRVLNLCIGQVRQSWSSSSYPQTYHLLSQNL